MLRYLFVSMALAIGFAGADQKGPSTVTLDLPGTTVRQALARISQVSGVALSVSGPIADDILVLSLNEMPLDQVRARIATATLAQWQPMGEGFRLVRTAKEIGAFREEEKAKLTPAIERAIGLARQMKAAAGPITEERVLSALRQGNGELEIESHEPYLEFSFEGRMRRNREMLANSPGARLLVEVLAEIGAPRLAEICATQPKTTLATQPTPLQHALTFPDRLWDAFLLEQNAAAAAARTFQEAENRDSEEGNVTLNMRWRYRRNGLFESESIRAFPAKVIVQVEGWGGPSGTLRIDYKYFDEKGAILLQDNFQLPLSPEPMPDPETPAAKEPPLEVSRLALELWTRPRYVSEGEAPLPPLSAELRRKAFYPEQYELLGLHPSEVLIAAAKRWGKDLVAVLPDDAFVYFGGSDEPPTPRVVRAELNGFCHVFDDAGAVVARPDDPIETTKARADRRGLGRLIRAAAQTGRVTVADAGAYAFACREDDGGAGYAVLDLLLQKEFNILYSDWACLRFYGSLSPLQLATLQAGGKLPIASLTPDQTAGLIEGFLERDAAEFQQRDDEDETEPAEGDESRPEPEEPPDILFEPTEFLVRGLDPAGWLTLKTSIEDTIGIETKSEDGRMGTTTSIEGFAQMLFRARHPQLEKEQFDGFDRAYTERTLGTIFLFHLGAPRLLRESLDETLQGPNFTAKKLPPELQAQIDKLLSKYEDQLKKGTYGEPPPDPPSQPRR